MTDVVGANDPRFAAVRGRLEEAQRVGLDEGMSFGAAVDGTVVAHLWAGHADVARQQRWTDATVCVVFSTSKVYVVLATLMVHDRGLLDLDAPVADVWPAFARHGKETITARDVLTHRSGLPSWHRPLTVAEAQDWEFVMGVIEDAVPDSAPGVRTHYHAQTFGHVLAEVVRRTTGEAFDVFVEDEITGPLGLAPVYGVAGRGDDDRIAQLWPTSWDDVAPEDRPDMIADIPFTTENVLRYCAGLVPAGSAITDGRSVARVGAIVAGGGTVDGRRYLSPQTVAEAVREQHVGRCPYLGKLRLGLGLGLHADWYPAPTPTTVHWGGFGGSFATMDPVSGLSTGFVPNRHLTGDADRRRTSRLWDAIGRIER